MDDQIKEIIDHYQITKLINEYCHGCDRMDAVRMAAIYAADSWDDHGANKCAGPEYVRRAIEEMPKTIVCSHLMGQTLIEVTGDKAGAESLFIATVRTGGTDGQLIHNQLGGRYVDSLVRESGAWKVKKRIVVRDWSLSQPVYADWLEGRPHVQGQRSNEDPSFAVLGILHSQSAAAAGQ